MLAREEAESPILLPGSKLWKNQVSCTKAHAAAQSRASSVHASGAASFTAFTSSSQHDQTSDALMVFQCPLF